MSDQRERQKQCNARIYIKENGDDRFACFNLSLTYYLFSIVANSYKRPIINFKEP